MAEHALSYLITLVVVANVSVIVGLTAIVALVPRMTRRRPAHRAEAAPLRARLALVPSRPSTGRGAALTAVRAA